MGFLCIYLSTNHVTLNSPVHFAVFETESLRLYIYIFFHVMLLQSKSAGAFILEPESFLFRFLPRLANRWLDAGFVRQYRCHVLECFIYERKTCVSIPEGPRWRKIKHFCIIRPHQMSVTTEDNSSSPAQLEEPRRAPNSMSKTRNLTSFLTILSMEF